MGGGHGVVRRPEDRLKPIPDGWGVKHSLLSSTLQLAVPLWIDQLRRQPWEYIQQRAEVCSQVVAEKGDIILFKSEKKGETAKAFNHLAEGLACLAFVPGGVKIFGGHWEACLDDEIPQRSKTTLLKLLGAIEKGLNDGRS